VRNVSAGGMLIRPYSPVTAGTAGTAVAVELKHGDMVRGIAKWIEGGLVGIAFEQPIDVVSLLTSPEDGPQPRMPRIKLNCTAWVREDADIYRTRTLNILAASCRHQGDRQPGWARANRWPGQMEGRRALWDRVQPRACRQRADEFPPAAAAVR